MAFASRPRARERAFAKNGRRRRIRRPIGGFLALALLAPLLSGGCARLAVVSHPEGAAVLWSPDGLPPWRPWPPLHWREYGGAPPFVHEADRSTTPPLGATPPPDAAASPGVAAASGLAPVRGVGSAPLDVPVATTPFAQRGPHADYLFVTVAKEGYYAPRPQLVGMRLFRTARAEFALRETPAHFAARQRALGRVPYGGAWVDPAEYGLVEYEGDWMPETERRRRAMRARGLVEFEGRWVTPDDYEAAFAARQRERGFVRFKDRWITPQARALEERLDDAVERLAPHAPFEMSPPRVLGRFESDRAGLGFVNPSPHPVRCLLAGPASRWIDLAPRAEIEPEDFLLLPGRYTVAVFALAPRATPAPDAPPPLPPTAPPDDFLADALAPPLGEPVVLTDQPVSAGFLYQLLLPLPE